MTESDRSVRRVALTGGIATGKSHVLNRLRELGARVIDSDDLAREVVRPGTPGLSAIVQHFGDVLSAGGELDRKKMASRVFGDEQARRTLEAIIHPLVYQEINRWFQRMPADAVAIVEIPLLYETGHAKDFDFVIVVASTPDQQRERLTSRDRLSDEEIRQRLAAQLPIEIKRQQADAVIESTGSLNETDRQVDALYHRLRGLLAAER